MSAHIKERIISAKPPLPLLGRKMATDAKKVEERKIAVIPKVIIDGALGPKEYGILLTNKRSLFVLISSNKTTVGYLLGGIGGAIVASSLGSNKDIDYANADVEELRKDEKNISVRHSKLTRLVMKKGLSGYTLRMEYDIQDKGYKVSAKVVPPSELVKQRKSEGAAHGEIEAEYVEKMKRAFEMAMSPEAKQKMEWLV